MLRCSHNDIINITDRKKKTMFIALLLCSLIVLHASCMHACLLDAVRTVRLSSTVAIRHATDPPFPHLQMHILAT
jgi:hypothetical protein